MVSVFHNVYVLQVGATGKRERPYCVQNLMVTLGRGNGGGAVVAEVSAIEREDVQATFVVIDM